MAGTTRLSELKELYNGLSRGEKQTLATYVKSYEDDLIPTFRYTGSFVDVLESDPEISLEKIVKKLKLNPKDSLTINSLLLKVQELILQTPVLDQNLHRPGLYRNRFRIRAANEKKLTQAEIFLDRGLTDAVEKMLSDIQTKADKYELPDQVASSLKLQRLIAMQWRSLRTYNRLDAELQVARRKEELHNRAEDAYVNFRLNQKRDSFDRQKFTEYVQELNHLSEEYPADTVKYYAGRVQLALDRLDYDYNKAIDRVQSLLELVNSSPALKSKRAESDLYYDLGYIQMQKRNLQGAREAFSKGEKLVKNETYENYRFKRDILLIDFYQDKLDEAKDTIETRINSTYTRQKSFASAQYHFLRAMSAYLVKNHRVAVRQLGEEIKVMDSPQSKEALGHHVILLMAAAEMQQKDAAPAKDAKEAKEMALESVKHIKAIRKRTDLTARDMAIIDLMVRLANNDFDFRKSYKSVKRFLVRLRKQKNDLIWEPFTYEIMPVQYWYEAQLDRRRTGMKLPPSPGTGEDTPDLTSMAEDTPPKKPGKRGRPRKVKTSESPGAKPKATKTKKAKTKAVKPAKTVKPKAEKTAKATSTKAEKPKQTKAPKKAATKAVKPKAEKAPKTETTKEVKPKAAKSAKAAGRKKPKPKNKKD